jgi:regulatory protein
MNSTRYISTEEALTRLQNLCSSQEKCTGDVREKLRLWNIPPDEQEKIINSLVNDKFIDDQRFAGFFVRDKQKINKWGKEKIRYALIHKGLSKSIMDGALESMPAENYESVLRELLTKKSKELGKYESYEKKNRLIRFAVQRGFSYDLIFRVLDDFI